MPLTAGTRLGPYEIVDSLGAGGMGEVYRARDTKLGRSVALKTIPDSFANDGERLARFEREARTLATLNHPHIAQIYGLEESQGTRALVMELVDGEDLSQRLARGPIPVREAMRIAGQIAEAIEAAHEQGIIHRDLKPANIKVTRDGLVKVLDFGLAKGVEAASGIRQPTSDGLASPTITSPAMTQAGMILGTAAYMSPEQAHGQAADKRSDVWAFGCVLYEILTGRRAFAGNDVIDTLAAVVRSEPDFSGWPADAPPTIKMLVQSCLTKDRRERVSDIAAARYVLRQAAAGDSTTAMSAPTHASRRSREPWYAALAALSTLVAVVLGGLLMLRPASPPRPPAAVVRLSLLPPAEHAFRPSGIDRDFAITPDGLHFVYRTRLGQLAVRQLGAVQPKLLSTEAVRAPFVSPDGRWIGYWASGAIRKIPLEGGTASLIAQSSSAPRGHTWGPDNTIVFATNAGEGLRRVSANGGAVESLTTLGPGEQGHTYPSYLPDGQAVLFTILAGGLDRTQVALLDLRTRQHKVLMKEGSQPVYVEPGYIVFRAGTTLRAVRFDRERAEVLGSAETVVEDVSSSSTGSANSDVALNGTLVYLAGPMMGQDRFVVWADRSGKRTPVGLPHRAYISVRVAPDQRRILADARDEEQDVWVGDLQRGTLRRLSFGPSLDGYPVWMPDGQSVLYSSSREGALAVFRQAADGTGTASRVAPGPAGEGLPVSVPPDGKSAIVRRAGRLALLGLSGAPSTETLSQGDGTELNAEVSPDGRWVAFDSSVTGRSEIYVRPFPRVNDGKWQVSSSGGSKPAWARGGKELFYEDQSGAIVAVDVELGPSFSPGVPHKLFDVRSLLLGVATSRSWDVAPDGRFLMIRDSADDSDIELPNMTVVLNWVEELKAKLPEKN